jgi:hypothetical protein
MLRDARVPGEPARIRGTPPLIRGLFPSSDANTVISRASGTRSDVPMGIALGAATPRGRSAGDTIARGRDVHEQQPGEVRARDDQQGQQDRATTWRSDRPMGGVQADGSGNAFQLDWTDFGKRGSDTA